MSFLCHLTQLQVLLRSSTLARLLVLASAVHRAPAEGPQLLRRMTNMVLAGMAVALPQALVPSSLAESPPRSSAAIVLQSLDAVQFLQLRSSSRNLFVGGLASTHRPNDDSRFLTWSTHHSRCMTGHGEHCQELRPLPHRYACADPAAPAALLYTRCRTWSRPSGQQQHMKG